MKLYHGSYLKVESPQVVIGRKNLDFGQGFYLTALQQQAEDWAQIISSRKGEEVVPYLNIYDFDLETALSDGYRHLNFTDYNVEWLEFIVNNRKGMNLWEAYDIIEGGVANDRVIDTVEDYASGIITIEQAIGQLKYKKINHQICILNQQVIEKYLRFKECIALKQWEE